MWLKCYYSKYDPQPALCDGLQYITPTNILPMLPSIKNSLKTGITNKNRIDWYRRRKLTDKSHGKNGSWPYIGSRSGRGMECCYWHALIIAIDNFLHETPCFNPMSLGQGESLDYWNLTWLHNPQFHMLFIVNLIETIKMLSLLYRVLIRIQLENNVCMYGLKIYKMLLYLQKLLYEVQ